MAQNTRLLLNTFNCAFQDTELFCCKGKEALQLRFKQKRSHFVLFHILCSIQFIFISSFNFPAFVTGTAERILQSRNTYVHQLYGF